MKQNYIMIPVMDSFGLKNFIFDMSTQRIRMGGLLAHPSVYAPVSNVPVILYPVIFLPRVDIVLQVLKSL